MCILSTLPVDRFHPFGDGCHHYCFRLAIKTHHVHQAIGLRHELQRSPFVRLRRHYRGVKEQLGVADMPMFVVFDHFVLFQQHYYVNRPLLPQSSHVRHCFSMFISKPKWNHRFPSTIWV